MSNNKYVFTYRAAVAAAGISLISRYNLPRAAPNGSELKAFFARQKGRHR